LIVTYIIKKKEKYINQSNCPHCVIRTKPDFAIVITYNLFLEFTLKLCSDYLLVSIFFFMELNMFFVLQFLVKIEISLS